MPNVVFTPSGKRGEFSEGTSLLDAARASYEVAELERALLNLTMTNIRTVMGSMDLDSLLSHRDAINSNLLSVIDSAGRSARATIRLR